MKIPAGTEEVWKKDMIPMGKWLPAVQSKATFPAFSSSFILLLRHRLLVSGWSEDPKWKDFWTLGELEVNSMC